MKQRGFSLLEMLVALAVMGIVLGMAIPNSVTVIRYELRHAALLQMRQVRNAEAELAICNAQQIACPGVSAQIPPAGSITMSGYTYVYASGPNGAWSYQAVPVASNSSYYVDQSGQIRYSDNGNAMPTSAVLQ